MKQILEQEEKKSTEEVPVKAPIFEQINDAPEAIKKDIHHDKMQKAQKLQQVTIMTQKLGKVKEILENNLTQKDETNNDYFADILKQDLEEDSVKITKETLDGLMKNPSDPKYKLQAKTIERLQNLTEEDQTELKELVIQRNSTHDKFDFGWGEKFMDFAEDVWEVITGLVKKHDEDIDKGIQAGANYLEKKVDEHFDNEYLTELLKSVIEQGSAILQDFYELEDHETTVAQQVAGETLPQQELQEL
jgi:hypothetical protein